MRLKERGGWGRKFGVNYAKLSSLTDWGGNTTWIREDYD